MTSEVAFVDGATRCVIKRCRNPIYLEWLSREHRVLRALADSALPVPRVLGYPQVDKKEEGREAWLVIERVQAAQGPGGWSHCRLDGMSGAGASMMDANIHHAGCGGKWQRGDVNIGADGFEGRERRKKAREASFAL